MQTGHFLNDEQKKIKAYVIQRTLDFFISQMKEASVQLQSTNSQEYCDMFSSAALTISSELIFVFIMHFNIPASDIPSVVNNYLQGVAKRTLDEVKKGFEPNLH